MIVRRVHELIAALADVDPDAAVDWEHVGPDECCPGHVHDINLTVGHDAEVYVSAALVTISLSGGHA